MLNPLNLLKMKQYIQPTTQTTDVALLSVLCWSVVEGDPNQGLAPERSFQGDTQGLKYLI